MKFTGTKFNFPNVWVTFENLNENVDQTTQINVNINWENISLNIADK